MADPRPSQRLIRSRGAAGRFGLLGAVCLALTLPGCSIKKMAINTVSDALAESGSTFASDDDPEIIRDAVPFSRS